MRRTNGSLLRRACAGALLLLVACARTAGSAGPGLPPLAPSNVAAPPLGTYIKHVVIIVQENRSFDNLFTGFPKANSASFGFTSTGQKVTLKAIPFSGTPPAKVTQDFIHDWKHAINGWDGGKMDGFDKNVFSGGVPVGTFPYSYVARKLVTPYWTMAKQYVLADAMFPTMFGGSFTAHLDLIAGTAGLSPKSTEVDWPNATPWGCDAPPGTTSWTLSTLRGPATSPTPVPVQNGPFPCFTQFRTMADTLNAKHVSWRYYAPAIGADEAGSVWSEFDAIKNVRNNPSEWTKTGKPVGSGVSWPPTNVLADAAAGTLPAVSWVIPDNRDSDHPSANSDTGPSWVAAVVNAVGKSPEWKSTAIVVLWDDWGGWFDNVDPPRPDFNGAPEFIGLGIRVPCIIISPYAKKGYVSHTQYEFSSVLKFVEAAFDLPVVGPPSFGYTDTRATSIIDSFDFTQKPRAFKAIPAKYPASHFIGAKPSTVPPDDD
jgi:phospholipase C